MSIDKIISILREAESIAILPHISVDGDGLGSSLALGLALEKLNKRVTIWLEEEVPAVYSFLPGRQLVKLFGDSSEGFDVAAALDTGDLERLGRRVEIFKNAKITVNMDHHPTNTLYGDYHYVQPDASAVGEIVYQLIKLMGLELNAEISACLYVALATDTGGFRYGNTTAVTHQITGDLIDNGANVAEISQLVFDTISLEKVRLMREAIDSLELLENGRASVITITDEAMRAVGAKDEDCDGIINLGRNIKGVEIAVMLRQRNGGEVKVNLRSKSNIDVSAIARKYSGGGHLRAAGFTMNKEIHEVKNIVLDEIRKVL